jgi:hypothetical protein
MASGGYLSSDNFSAYGGTFGVYDDFLHAGPVRIGGDARFFIQSSGDNNNPYVNQMRGGLAGARVAFFSHAVPFTPYIQAEIGGVGTNYGTQPSRSTSFAYQVQVGLDYTIIPHLDARFEYGAGEIGAQFPGNNQQGMQQVGLGLVARFY